MSWKVLRKQGAYIRRAEPPPLTSPPPTRKSSSQIGSGQPAGLANHRRFSSGSENPWKAWLGLQS